MSSKQDSPMSQIQRDVGEIRVSIARIEENVKNGISKDGETEIKLKEFNSRITKLEEWQWKAIGISAAVFTIISVALQFFIK